jgi:hypothetical protein
MLMVIDLMVLPQCYILIMGLAMDLQEIIINILINS